MKDIVILTGEDNHFMHMLHLVIGNKYVVIHLQEGLLCDQIRIKLFILGWYFAVTFFYLQ